MTGLDRLRGYARRMDELHVWPGGARLREIAGQIEREHDAEVADSPYDAILPEDREAAAWVREHGGLDAVRSEWSSRVPYEKHEQRRQRLLGHIAECEAALGRRNQRIEKLGRLVGDLTRENAKLRCMSREADNRRVELCAALGVDLDMGWSDAMDAMRLRLVPEDVEWPRFEDGEPVRFGDVFLDHQGNMRSVYTIKMWQRSGFEIGTGHGAYDWHSDGECVRRPEPQVLAADGKPLREKERVYHVETGAELVVKSLPKPGEYQTVVVVAQPANYITSFDPDQLTHERPDTWERIEEDAKMPPHFYCVGYMLYGKEEEGSRTPTSELFARDLVRRCREVARRERGE